MVCYGLFEAWIQVPNGPIPEYNVKIDGKELSCYIPCQPQSYFQVHWVDHGTGLHTAAWIVVDGVISPGKFIEGSGYKCRAGFRIDSKTEIPFAFTKDKGTIELKIALVKDGSRRPSDDPEKLNAHRLEMLGDEGYGQHVDFKYTTKRQADYTFNVEGPGKPAESCVKFIFHYRPKDLLYQRGILALPSKPPPEMQRFIDLHTKAQAGSHDASAIPAGPTMTTPVPFPSHQTGRRAPGRDPTPFPAPVPGEVKVDKGKKPVRPRTRSKRRKSNKSSDVSILVIMERHRDEVETVFKETYGYNPDIPKFPIPDTKPASSDLQQNPRASNTYVVPTQAVSSSMPGPSSMPPPVDFPYITRRPYARPPAVIDTRFLACRVKMEPPSSSQ